MAKKRMFSIAIVDTDAFLDMPLSTQALYFHLNMRADDDGFVGNPKRIQSFIGASEDDLKLLIAKRFILVFENGVIVIKHWRMHNTLRKDRYTPTNYLDELHSLGIKENKAYTDDITKAVISWLPDGCQIGNPDIDKGKEIDKDKEIDIDKDKENISSKELEEFFDAIWAEYPVKRGKGSVSKSKKKILYKIGIGQLKRCINRYLAETDKRYLKNGSTFFNSAYVDYLDKNYDGAYCRNANYHTDIDNMIDSGAFD